MESLQIYFSWSLECLQNVLSHHSTTCWQLLAAMRLILLLYCFAINCSWLNVFILWHLLMLCVIPAVRIPQQEKIRPPWQCNMQRREIYCWLEPGPLLQTMQQCKVRESWAPVSTHIYRVLNFKHKQWVVGTSGLVTCLQSNFIGTNFRAHGTFQGTFSEVYWAHTD